MIGSEITLLQQTEEEKVQLAQKLLGLCTSVLKVNEISKVQNFYIAFSE